MRVFYIIPSKYLSRGRLAKDDVVVCVFEPLYRVLLLYSVVGANGALCSSSDRDSLSGSGHDDVEVHTVNTDGGVVFETEINVLIDTESKVSG